MVNLTNEYKGQSEDRQLVAMRDFEISEQNIFIHKTFAFV
jgi:hypothetical protein